jgi:CRP/FNR family cyclic AMP-dependent transcriptional regulator
MSVDERREVAGCLLRSYSFEGMTAEQVEPLARVSAVRRLVRGEYVWHAGDPAEELYVVLSGEVKDCLVDMDGNEVIHFTYGPGMTFGEPGFFAQERYRILDVIAMMPTALIRLTRGDLGPFLEQHGVVKDHVLERLASDARFETNLISSLLTQPLAQRLVLRLLELIDPAAESEPGQAVTPKITQSTLAAMIGVSRENVNRALGALALVCVLTDAERLRREVAQGWPLGLRRDRRTGPATS